MKRFLLSFLILTAGVLHAQDALGTLLGPPDDDFSAKTKVDLLVELAEAKPGTIVTVACIFVCPRNGIPIGTTPVIAAIPPK